MRLILGIFAVTTMLWLTACANNPNERLYLSPYRYKQAMLLYDEVGSMKLTKEILKDQGWRDGEINQFEYTATRELGMTLAEQAAS